MSEKEYLRIDSLPKSEKYTCPRRFLSSRPEDTDIHLPQEYDCKSIAGENGANLKEMI
jgi:hypothetical protein